MKIKKITLDLEIAQKLLEYINKDIERCIDNPMYHGRAPEYMYILQSSLKEEIEKTI